MHPDLSLLDPQQFQGPFPQALSLRPGRGLRLIVRLIGGGVPAPRFPRRSALLSRRLRGVPRGQPRRVSGVAPQVNGVPAVFEPVPIERRIGLGRGVLVHGGVRVRVRALCGAQLLFLAAGQSSTAIVVVAVVHVHAYHLSRIVVRFL